MRFHAHGLLLANPCILTVLDYCVEHNQEMLDHECSDSGGHEQYWYRARSDKWTITLLGLGFLPSLLY